MEKTCPKCGHANANASGAATDACPSCGVIYAKVDPEQSQTIQARRDQLREKHLQASSAVKKDTWKYVVLGTAVAILIPWWIYQEVWGITAHQRKSAASRAAASVVSNSGWDGSVHQVERYLKKNLKDPASFEAIEWSAVVPSGNGFSVRVKYRAKNSFGGYAIENQIFQLDSRGEVVGVTNI